MATIRLLSNDGEMFEVDEGVAFQSAFIKNMVEEKGSSDPIPLPNVSGNTFAKVVEYCKFHLSASKDDVKAFDADFVKVDQETLFDLIRAATSLNIKELLDLTCQTVLDAIKGKTPEEIRRIFNIGSTFTPEEEEEVRRENLCAFE